ncbi:hypothetical protein ABPG74_007923 [Tetrahymena malaccensis]
MENQIVQLTEEYVSLLIKQEELSKQICLILDQTKDNVKLKLQNKQNDDNDDGDDDDERILVEIKGQKLQNLFDFDQMFFEKLEFNDLDNYDHTKFSIKTITLHLNENFLEDNLLINFGQEISKYEVIQNLALKNYGDFTFSETSIENLKNFIKNLKNLCKVNINFYIDQEKYIPFLEILNSLTKINCEQQIKIGSLKFCFKRDSDKQIEYLNKQKQFFYQFTMEGLAKLIRSVNALNSLKGLCFNIKQDQIIVKDLFKDQPKFEIGGKHFKVLDTDLPIELITSILKVSHNLESLKLNSAIYDSSYNFLFLQQTNLQELQLTFNFLEYGADQIIIPIKQFQKINNLNLQFKLQSLNKVQQVLEDLDHDPDKIINFYYVDKCSQNITFNQQPLNSTNQNMNDEYLIDISTSNFNINHFQFLIKTISKIINPKLLQQDKQIEQNCQQIEQQSNKLLKRYCLTIDLSITYYLKILKKV